MQVGEKLRKKRMRSKRKGNTLARRHSFELNVRKKRFGCNRSVVRYIGSNVPLAPTERAYFEVFQFRKAYFVGFVLAN